jgi:hypothetical protein
MKSLGISFFLWSSALLAQHISVGIKGGVPFNGGFADASQAGVDLVTRSFSDSNNYIIGPMIEVHLPFSLSIEADALYRPLSLAVENQLPTIVSRSVIDPVSWEFPVLGRFRLPFPIVKPFVEAGPSFRTVGSNRGYLSNKGFLMGIGVELKVSRVRFGPEIRYTRWGDDARPSPGVGFQPPSSQNQGEFLLGLSF